MTDKMTAIEEARMHRYNIEQEICKRLTEFTNETGLRVTTLDLSCIDCRTVGDKRDLTAYSLRIEVTI
ncbi:hypothetical protein LCGC14_0481560 [marine sediment metagenome]|uniref:Uncharacterized protein n=1 Tax=marine sediment metagenome TaxID=412755 RepID=A0A0F9UW77_9ZZZZ